MAEASSPTDAPTGPEVPVPKDAIDPELVRLRRPRPQIGAVTALGVVIFCAYVAIRLDGDRRFAGEPETARPVAVDAIAAGKVDTDSHVAVTARIERASAVRVQPNPANPGLRLAPVLGSRDRVWLALPGDGRSDPAPGGSYRGRLYDFDELHFADPMRERLARPHPQFVRGADLHKVRPGEAAALPTVHGSEVRIAAETPLEIEVADPEAATVIATFNDRFPDVAAWTAALAQAAVISPDVVPSETTEATAMFSIRGPDATAATQKKLDAAGLGGARVDAVTARHLAPWREVTATEAGLTFPAGASLPWSAIDVAAVWLPRVPPASAYVVVVDEAPAQYWYVMPIYVAVIGVGLLFGWALVRAIKRDFLA